MSESSATPTEGGKRRWRINWSLLVTLAAVAAVLIFWHQGMTLGFLLSGVVLISIVIWQACDPFAEAAQYIGIRMRLPSSVRGATLDAVASSMPELFSGIFFVLVAFWAIRGDFGDAAMVESAGAEGFGSTIATCAGSAIYNMILIPAIVALTIAVCRKDRRTVEIENSVLARDGIWFLVCEMVLLTFLYQDHMYWWMGLVFIGMYVIYIGILYRDTGIYRKKLKRMDTFIENAEGCVTVEMISAHLEENGGGLHPRAIERHLEGVDGDEEEEPDAAEVFFGFIKIPLNLLTAWLVILVATVVAAVACYFLVEAVRGTADTLGVPVFFVAVILAAAASSLPDTFLSLGAARRGDDSGAVSNAFGSNIFDICICLSIPLIVSAGIAGWKPVALTQDGEPIPGLLGLRILLFILTALTLAIMWHRRELTWKKALVLCGLYLVFIAYAVAGSLKLLTL